jgi:hypothetical protein
MLLAAVALLGAAHGTLNTARRNVVRADARVSSHSRDGSAA